MLAVTLVSWILLVCYVSCQGCKSGWFGSQCEYKCHCALRTNCDGDGQCPDNQCQGGWFGPACQYADLAFLNASTQEQELIDGNDASCVSTNIGSDVTVKLNNTYPFSWLRVHLKNAEYLSSLQVKLNSTLSCVNQRTAIVDDKTLDIHCGNNERVESVTLTGDGVQYLCSLYISGGRNVALNQATNQSTTYEKITVNYTSDLAVDGKTDSRLYEGASCAHTDEHQTLATWTVLFSKLYSVNRYVLFNRNGDYKYRLQKFTLTALARNGREVFTYRDTDETVRDVYTVISAESVISQATVQAHNNENILTLCEVEIYGESSCELGQYGRDCEHRCNCAGGVACFVSTGGCPSGCPDGYTGESCSTICRNNTWGNRCKETCSDNCATPTSASLSPCNNTNGWCINSCRSGYQGLLCDKECDRGKYGPSCASTCSVNCFSVGDSRPCDHVNGNCLKGCKDGYTGDNCCSPRLPEDHALITGLIVGICVAGVAVVVMAVVVAVILCRRSSEQRSPYNNTNNSEQDIHEYEMPKLGDDGYVHPVGKSQNPVEGAAATSHQKSYVKPRIELRSDTQPQADAENVDRIYEAI